MAKYTYELKKKIVKEYQSGKISAHELARKYNLGNGNDYKSVLKWSAAYGEFGDDALRRSRKKSVYSFEYKVSVVEFYLSTEVSYQELALTLGMNDPCLLAKWVSDYRNEGPDALRPKKKGRKKSLDSSKNGKIEIQNVNATPVDTSAEHIKQLEDELLKLQIENAFLKEVRRLRLEEEALLKKQRESSTASGETSN